MRLTAANYGLPGVTIEMFGTRSMAIRWHAPSAAGCRRASNVIPGDACRHVPRRVGTAATSKGLQEDHSMSIMVGREGRLEELG